MNDTVKTFLFVAAAAAAMAMAWALRPSLPVSDGNEMIGQKLFAEFTDPLTATRLEILQYDEGTASVRRFEVAQVKDRWVIPSHDNYPTDAKDQLAQAAGPLTFLKVLEVTSSDPGDHAEYGVVDPDPKTLKPGTTGVGTRVTLRDKDNKVLLDLIVGKPVPDQSDLRYVRPADQDDVYVVAVKTDKLSTRFEDWIEKDLLKMSSWDVKGFQVRDYTLAVDLTGRARLDQRAEFRLAYGDSDPRWKLVEGKAFNKQKRAFEPAPLADDEELDTTKLDAMKSALDDLKIVDVNRKPPGLSANLKASGELVGDAAAARSLIERGFYPVTTDRGDELLSNKGDIRVLMKDGVEYVLRFGEIAGAGTADKSKDAKKDEKIEAAKDEKKDEPTGPGVNRYLFVMAEFNPDAIEKPTLEPLPPLPKEETPAEKKPAEKKPDDKKPEDKNADEKQPDDKSKDQAKPDPKAERERIEKENQRKEDEYKEKLKKGEEHVQELNARFADWYYVISDEVYRKIHLSRQDIVKKKEKKEETKEEGKAEGAKDEHDHAAPAAKDAAPSAASAKPDKQPAAAGAEEKQEAPAAGKEEAVKETSKKDEPSPAAKGPAEDAPPKPQMPPTNDAPADASKPEAKPQAQSKTGPAAGKPDAVKPAAGKK